jgi:hypothetical protein
MLADVRLNALFERDDTSASSASEEETSSDDEHLVPGTVEQVVLNFAAGGDHPNIVQPAAQSVGSADAGRRVSERSHQDRAELHGTARDAPLGGRHHQARFEERQGEMPPRHQRTAPVPQTGELSRLATPAPGSRGRAAERVHQSEASRLAVAIDSEDEQPTTPPETPPARRRAPQPSRPSQPALASEYDQAATQPETPRVRRHTPHRARQTGTVRRSVAVASDDERFPASPETSPETPPTRRCAPQPSRASQPVQRAASVEDQRPEARLAELRRAAREAVEEVLAEHDALLPQYDVDPALDRLPSQRRVQRSRRLDQADEEDQAVRLAARDQALRAIEALVVERSVQSRPRQAETSQSAPTGNRNLRARMAARELTRQTTGQQLSQPTTNTGRSRNTQSTARSSRRTTHSSSRTDDLNDARNSAQQEIQRRADERARGLTMQ